MPKGVVSKIFEKQWDDGKTYSFKLSGDETFYRLGKISPQFSEGSSIQFDAVTKGANTYVNEAPSPWTDGGATQAPAIPTTGGVYSGGQGGYKGGAGKKPYGKSEEEKVYWKARELRDVTVQKKIEIQAARNAALVAATFMWKEELVKVPTKQADKYDAFLTLVDLVADTFQKLTEAKVSGSTVDSGAERNNVTVDPAEVIKDKAAAKWED